MPITIEPLGNHHDRARFTCGQPDLDVWFRQRAGQDDRRNVARVFVAVDGDAGVVGFYSLGAFALTLTDLPDDIARKIPRYEAIPAALIGRLARDERMRGQRLGELLLTDAIKRIVSASHDVTVFAVVVDAKDDAAAGFYRAFGFQPFPSRPMRLFLLTATAIAALKRN